MLADTFHLKCDKMTKKIVYHIFIRRCKGKTVLKSKKVKFLLKSTFICSSSFKHSLSFDF